MLETIISVLSSNSGSTIDMKHCRSVSLTARKSRCEYGGFFKIVIKVRFHFLSVTKLMTGTIKVSLSSLNDDGEASATLELDFDRGFEDE